MKKLNYKAVDVKKLNWTSLQSKFQGQSVIFSVDVAKSSFVGLLISEDNDVKQLIKWQHPQETGDLLTQLESIAGTNLIVVMEPTGTYGDALRWQFSKRDILVYRVNPKHTHDQAETFDGVPSSHDAKACYIITDLHQRGHSQLWQELSVDQRDLQGLTRQLSIYQNVHSSNLNRLSAMLARHWPELEYIMDVNTVSVLSLLREFGEPRAVSENLKIADTLLCKVGRSGLKTEKRQALLDSSGQTLGIPCTEGERQYIQKLTADLLRTRKAIGEVEKDITKAVEKRDELSEIAKLCGNVTCVIITAILGDLRNYPNAQSLLKASGLNLKEHSSGQYKGRLQITKRGSSKVRFYLYWLALRLIKTDAQVKSWYQAKVARDGGRCKKLAIVAIMRKVVKALWHVAQGQAFDSRKLFNQVAV